MIFQGLFRIYYRVLWTISISIALMTTIYVSILISDRFNTSPIATVIESTNYHISDIPFPAISICPSNQLNFSKINEVIKKFFPYRSEFETKFFVDFLERVHNLGFWQFENLKSLFNSSASFNFLDTINITQITLFVKFYEFFVGKSID